MSIEILRQQINNALNQRGTEDPSELDRIKTTAANSIANAIDQYIQEQIGLRLQLLTTSILTSVPTPAGPVPTPPTPGPSFPQLTRIR